MEDTYDPYKKYGLKRVINAAFSFTHLGGSIPHPDVYNAMADASKSFVSIPELQQWAGKKIAEATGAESGLPTAGAENALVLAVAACMMKGTELENFDPIIRKGSYSHLTHKLPLHTEDLKNEFIIQKNNRFPYDFAVELAGGHLVEVGSEDGATEAELDAAYNPETTAAYYYTIRGSFNCLPLKTVVKIAHKHGVPVIVDAAAELPPKRKLKQYIKEGADLVAFSGGKHLAAPNNSGILAGRKDLIKLAHLQAYPFHGIGRQAKMSRETIVGFVTALRIYMNKDEEAEYKKNENKVKWIATQLGGIPGVEVGIDYQVTVDTKEPMSAVCYLVLDETVVGMSTKDLVDNLKKSDPIIFTVYNPHMILENYEGKMTIYPDYLLEEEEKIVVEKIKMILTAS